LLVLGLLSGCTKNWHESTLRLHTEGIAFRGNKVMKMGGHGTGFWLDKNHIATNVHVVVRSQNMVGESDDGTRYHFSRIVGFDRSGDIAILKAERDGDMTPVKLAPKPADPRDLRGEDVVVSGNTANLGLSLYFGKITNVIATDKAKKNHQIMHNTNTAPGASGSAIFLKDTGEVIGIHHSFSPQANSKMGTASWRIADDYAAAKNKRGTALKKLFTVQNGLKLTKIGLKRKFCLAPKHALKVPFFVPRNADFVAAFLGQGAVFEVGLLRGKKLVWAGKLKKGIFPFSTPPGGYTLIVIPAGSAAKSCGQLGIGIIEWEKGIH